MARPQITAAVLAQRGVPITLWDEREVTVCFTFRSLMLLEERFGSLGGAIAEVEKGEKGKAFTTVASVLAAGLTHEVDADGAPLSDPEVLADLLDSARLEAYSDAVGTAFARSFPDEQQRPTNAEANGTTPPRSPGETGTGSQLSTSDSPMTSSGA